MVLIRTRRRPGRPAIPTTSGEAQRRNNAHDPCLLATSLRNTAPDAVVAAYALRMKIEQPFRDAKNHRFGWSLRHVRCSSADRLNVMFLIAALAFLAVVILGFAGEQCKLHRAYQVNTVKRRVLSFFFLGLAILRRGDQSRVTSPIHFRATRAGFRLAIQELTPALPS